MAFWVHMSPASSSPDLEELQDQTEPQSRNAGLVADQLPVLIDESPRRDQILCRQFLRHEREQ